MVYQDLLGFVNFLPRTLLRLAGAFFAGVFFFAGAFFEAGVVRVDAAFFFVTFLRDVFGPLAARTPSSASARVSWFTLRVS